MNTQNNVQKVLLSRLPALALISAISAIGACEAPEDEEVDRSHLRSQDNELGIWLWDFGGTGFTNHGELADRLADMGVKRVYVKVADGGYSPDAWPEVDDK